MRSFVASVLVVVFAACGGQSLSRDGDDDGRGGRGGSQSTNGGSGPTGGAAGVSDSGGSGGTVVTGGFGGTLVTGGASGTTVTGGVSGTTVTGGVSGTTVTGGVSGTTVTGGAGGSAGLPEECALPIDSGPCEGAVRSYAFDSRTGLCVPFYYGGCEGNANRFARAEDCYRRCDDPAPGGPADCTQSGICDAIPTQCCGSCGQARWDNVVGVHYSNADIISRTKCATVDCTLCEPDPSAAWMGATCREGHCIAYDARETDMVECTATTDCYLRFGLACCQGCGGGLVALSHENPEYLCPDGHHPCPPCPTTDPGGYPDGVYAVCESGRCVVTDGI